MKNMVNFSLIRKVEQNDFSFVLFFSLDNTPG